MFLASCIGAGLLSAETGDSRVPHRQRRSFFRLISNLTTRFALLLSAVVPFAATGALKAQETSWNNLGTADWFVSGNWDNGVPTNFTDAIINNGGTSQIGAAGAEAREVRVGDTTSGELEIFGGGTLVSATHATIAAKVGSTGTVTVTGAGTSWNSSRNLFVGEEGLGDLTIADGASVISGVDTSTTDSIIGHQVGSMGKVTVTGMDSAWNSFASLTVGSFGAGELVINNGGKVFNVGGSIGSEINATGTVSVTGTGSLWDNNSPLDVGAKGTGALTVADGGEVTSFRSKIGADSGSSGTVVVTGADSIWTNRFQLTVGDFGSGSLRIADGGSVFSSTGTIAGNPGSTGTTTVTGAGSAWTIDSSLGVAGTGDLTIAAGGVVENADGGIGSINGSQGIVTVTGIGSEWNTRTLSVDGRLTIASGAEVSSRFSGGGGAAGTIASDTGTQGTVSVTGTDSKWNNDGGLQVGRGGDGNLTISAGGTVISSSGNLGIFSGAKGMVTVTGPGSKWTNTGELLVGENASGQLLVADGAMVSSGRASIGKKQFGFGTATVTGAGSTWTNNAELVVGDGRSGELTVANGATVSNAQGFIGRQASGSGTVTVSGTNSTWTNSSSLFVGDGGTGNLLIANGGSVSNTSGTLGNQMGSTGTVVVVGADSIWNNASSLTIGFFGSGEITIADGGMVVAPQVGLFSRGMARVENGGTLRADVSFVNTGLVEIDATGQVQANTITNLGMITNNGTITGDTTVQNGGLLSGSGVFNGTVTIESGGTFSPGASPGSGTTTEANWNAGGTYLWEINALDAFGGSEGNDPGWDLWQTGELSIDGPFAIALTTLGLGNEPGVLDGWNPSTAYQWRIATSENGAFASLDYLLLNVGGFQNSLAGGTFELSASNSGSDLILKFTPVPEPSSLVLLCVGGFVLFARRSVR